MSGDRPRRPEKNEGMMGKTQTKPYFEATSFPARDRSFDVVTLGEAMIRLSTQGPDRLEQANSLKVHAGGGEMNVACALSRLGLHTALITRLPSNALGRLAAGQLRFHGVDDSLIRYTSDSQDRMGLYFLELGATPRPDNVLYDRSGSAVTRMKPEMWDWEAIMSRTSWFHVTGITPALSHDAAETTERAVVAAREKNVTVSLDLNYRAKLWTLKEARPVMERLSLQAHHLITTEEDADRLFGIGGDDFALVARKLVERFGCRTAAVTVRQNLSSRHHRWTAVAFDGKEVCEDKIYDLMIVDRVGGGDAFSAGYIYGLLRASDSPKGLSLAVRYGNAVSALKASVPGDVSFATLEEVEALMAGTQGVRIQR